MCCFSYKKKKRHNVIPSERSVVEALMFGLKNSLRHRDLSKYLPH